MPSSKTTSTSSPLTTAKCGVGLVANSDFGLTYENAFKRLLDVSPTKDKIDFFTANFEITAPTVTDPMTTIASKNPEMFITMTGAVQCTQILNEAANNGLNDRHEVQVHVLGVQEHRLRRQREGRRRRLPSQRLVDRRKRLQGPDHGSSQDNDAFSLWARQVFDDNGVDSNGSSTYGQGLWQAWLWIQTLIIAGELPGGLTRTNFMLAQRAFAGTSPVHLKGITVAMNGNDDAYFLEGSDVSIWDSAAQTWVVQDILDANGKTPNCQWDTETNGCLPG